MSDLVQSNAQRQPLSHAKVNYAAASGLATIHVLAVASLPYLYFYGITTSELLLHLAFYLLGGLGITVLYHRSWAHNAARLSRPVEYVLAAAATLVIQMPAKKWIVHHIQHHQHTDSNDDPYNINRGFWWAHYEWIIFHEDLKAPPPARLADHPVVLWQAKYYWILCILLNVCIPVGLGVYVGAPWWGSLLISALRLVLMEHVVFSVNSVCHRWGTRPFSKQVSARDVWWFPFALGEQYHNYHHAFPRDYRHGIRPYDFDPSKWIIRGLASLGLARELVAMPAERIAAAKKQSAANGDWNRS